MNRALRITVLEPDPSFGGGSEAVSLDLARGLAARGHVVGLLHERDGSMLPSYREISASTHAQPLPGFERRRPLRALASVRGIARAMRAMRADVLLSSHLGYLRHAALLQALYGLPACFHLGLPCVGSSADLRWAYRHVGAGVAPSAHTAAGWRAGGWPDARLHVVPNWVDATRFSPSKDRVAARRALDLPSDGALILYVGRLTPAKGVPVLAEAFARLDPTLGAATLVLVGHAAPGCAEALDARLSAARLPEGRGWRIRPATATPEDYYRAADTVCVPSVEVESFGLTVAEAMSCGVPVVASSVGMIAEIVGEVGADLLAPPGDAAALASRLAAALREAPGSGRGQALRDRVMAHYDSVRGIDAYESILQGQVGR